MVAKKFFCKFCEPNSSLLVESEAQIESEHQSVNQSRHAHEQQQQLKKMTASATEEAASRLLEGSLEARRTPP